MWWVLQSFFVILLGAATLILVILPWEDILEELREKTLDKELQEIPRPQECLKYMWRAHVKVAGVDLKKQLKQVHVRPFVLVLLLDYLIEQRHEVFVGKGSAEELRQRMRAAVAREYPEQEADIPEEKRQGAMPPSILEVLRAQEAEKKGRTASPGKASETARREDRDAIGRESREHPTAGGLPGQESAGVLGSGDAEARGPGAVR